MPLRDMLIAIGMRVDSQPLSEADQMADAFRDNLTGATGESAKLDASVAAVGATATASMGEATEAAAGLAGWWERSKETLGTMGEKLKEYRVVIGAVAAITAGIVGTSIGVAADFEAGMSKVDAVSRATEAEMAQLEDTARHLGATTVFSATQAAEGMEYLSMAGFDTQQTIAAMPGLLDTAAAAGEGLGRSADIVSNILSGFNLEAEETGRISDVLTATFTSSNTTLGSLGDTMKMVAPVAASLGVGIEEVAALTGALGDAGIQGSMAGTSLRTVLTSLAAPTGDAAKQMAALGIQTTDAAGDMLPITDIIGDIAAKTEHMGEAQRAAFLETVAGRQGISAMSALLAVGSSRLDEYAGELRNSGGVAAEVADRQLDNLQGAMTQLRSAVEGAQISIGTAFIPVLRAGANVLTSVVTAFNRLPGPVQTATAVGLGAVAMVSSLALAASFLVPQIAAGIKMFAGLRTALAATRVGAMLTGTAIHAALWPVVAVIGVVTGAVLLFEDALTFLRGEGDSVIGRFYAWTEDIGFFGDVLRALADPIVQPFIALADVYRFVRGEGGTMTEETIAQLTKFYDTAVEKVDGVVDWFKTLPERTMGALSAWWGDITSWFATTFDFGGILSNALETAWDAIPKPLRGIAETIMGFFPQSPAKEGPLTALGDVGPAIVGELAHGLDRAGTGDLGGAMGDVSDSMMPRGERGVGPAVSAPAPVSGVMPKIELNFNIDARGATADDAETISQTTAAKVREVVEQVFLEAYLSTVMEEA